MDIASITGILTGILVILGTLFLETGSISSVLQPKAIIIVFGGTFAAALINYPLSVVSNALKEIKFIFYGEKMNFQETIDQICELAGLARQEGPLVIQELISSIEDHSLRTGLQLSVDTNNQQVLKEIFDLEIQMEEDKGLIIPIFYEAMGGYAPTFGIVGAVLGLIQVMSNIQSPADLGYGVSTAFVATLYGVGAANLLFLPISGKFRYKLREKLLYKKLVHQGILSIHKGENPILIKEKLLHYFYSAQNQNLSPLAV